MGMVLVGFWTRANTSASQPGQSWQAVFAFSLVGAIFLLWIMIMAYQVFADA